VGADRVAADAWISSRAGACDQPADTPAPVEEEQELGSDDAAQLLEQDAQLRLVGRRRLFAIDGRQELVAVHSTQPVEHEVGEEQPFVGTGQRVLDSPAAQLHDELAAQLDSRLLRPGHCGQGWKDRRKVPETIGCDHRSPTRTKEQRWPRCSTASGRSRHPW
jgi:hypothetical protein